MEQVSTRALLTRSRPNPLHRIWLKRNRIALHLALGFWTFIVCLMPIIWGISTSFKGRDELYKTLRPTLLP